MGWADFKTDLLAEWARLSGPGLYVFAGLGAAACAIWLLMNSRYGSMIASLRERAKKAEDRWRGFEAALPGMTPSQAADRIRRLEGYVAQLPPRRLDEKQKNLIAAVGCPPAEAPYLTVVHEAASAEANRFALDLVEAFSATAGWNVVDEPYPAGVRVPTVGVAVALTHPAKPTATEHLVLMALQDAKVTHEIVPRSEHGGDAQIIVSSR